MTSFALELNILTNCHGCILVVEGDVFYPHALNIIDNLDSLERRIIFQLGLSVYYSDQT